MEGCENSATSGGEHVSTLHVNGYTSNDLQAHRNGGHSIELPDHKNGHVLTPDENGNKTKVKESESRQVGVFEMFRFAAPVDVVLILLGWLFACAHGVGLPCMIIVFGQMIDSFVEDAAGLTGMQNSQPHCNKEITPILNASLSPTDLETALAMKGGNATIPQMYMENSNLLDTMETFSYYFIAIGAGVMVCGYLQVACSLIASNRQVQRMRNQLFQSILKQEVGWYDTHDIGELNTRLTEDINKIHEGIGDKLASFCQWFTAFLAGIIIGFSIGWLLTLVILSVSPLIIISGGFMSKLMQSSTAQELTAYAKAGSVAEEVLGAIRTVTAFGGQKKEIIRYSNNLEDAKKFGIKKGFTSGGMGLVFFFIFCSYGLAIWFGGKLIREEQYCHHEYTVGKMITVFFAVLIGAFSLGNAFPNLTTFSESRGAAQKVYEIIDRKSAIDSSSDQGQKPCSVEGTVAFKDVVFRYPSRPNVPVLNGLNLEVRVGQTAALVGSSGCGKSTTVQLLQRFYDVISGEITIDGRNVKDLNIKWLRQHIGVVGQEPVLFGVTIAENIRYGRDGVTQAEIEVAAKNANAHSFITSFPKGYETQVGDRGAQMSGGQKQRIAIARALVRDPKILLLDEATSALDSESEATVQAALDKARLGRTTLIVAHRLSTIKNADVIFGFKDGVVSEKGSHNELMAAGGIYATLVQNQQHHHHGDDEISSESEFEDVALETEDIGLKHRNGSLHGSLRKRARTLSTAESTISGKLEDEGDLEKTKEEKGSFLRVLKLNSKEWYFIVLGCLGAGGNGAVQPAFAIIFSEMLGIFALPLDEQESEVAFYALMFLVLALGAFLSMFIQNVSFAFAGENLTKRIRELSFAALLRQEMAYFDDHSNNLGALTTRLATEASAVQGASGPRLGTMVQAMSCLGVGIIIGLVYSWKLALVVMAFMPAIALMGMLRMKAMKGTAGQNTKALEDAGKIAIESLENIRTVASLTKEPTFAAEYKRLTENPYKDSVKKAHLSALAFGFSHGLIFMAYAAIFYFGAWLIKNDGLNFVDLFKVFAAIVFGAMQMGQASAFAPDYGKGISAAAKVFKLLDRVPAIDNSSEEGQTPEDFHGTVTFKHVRFVYPTRPTVPVLRGLSFSIETGQTVALVGGSGCGKSTSVQLIERFYAPMNGQVYFDKNPLERLNLQWVRQQTGLVQQEPVLFDCTIRENIAYGDNQRVVPMDEIMRAARDANIHEFITSLPQGYDTNVGDKGAQLSGGQKQRVAIARALVRNPKLLLLDEATSALDTESEKVVQEALDRAQQGRTSVVIAHRLSTIKNADKIIVIHEGRACEEGTHTELMEQKGRYYRLIMKSQRKEDKR